MSLIADALDDAGATPLHVACVSNDVNLLLIPLSLTHTRSLFTLDHLAFQADLVHCLVSRGASLAINGARGLTPLHYCVVEDSLAALEAVLSLCPKEMVNATSDDGVTPLHIACQRDFVGGIERLLDAGADVTNRSPLLCLLSFQGSFYFLRTF